MYISKQDRPFYTRTYDWLRGARIVDCTWAEYCGENFPQLVVELTPAQTRQLREHDPEMWAAACAEHSAGPIRLAVPIYSDPEGNEAGFLSLPDAAQAPRPNRIRIRSKL